MILDPEGDEERYTARVEFEDADDVSFEAWEDTVGSAHLEPDSERAEDELPDGAELAWDLACDAGDD